MTKGHRKPRKRVEEEDEEEFDEEEDEEDEDSEEDEDEEDEDSEEDEDEEDEDEDEEEEEPPRRRRGGKGKAEVFTPKSVSGKAAATFLKKSKKKAREDFEAGAGLPIMNPELEEVYDMTISDAIETQYRRSTRYHKAGDPLLRIIFEDPECVRLVSTDSAEGKAWQRWLRENKDNLPMDIRWGITEMESAVSGRNFHYLAIEER